MRSAILIFFSISTAYFADSFHLVPRIIGGKVAKIKQFRYQVSFRFINSRAHFCGGSILSSRFLVTTAHCTCDETIEKIYAVVGAIRGSISSNIDEDGVFIKLEKIIEHEYFNRPTLENDIAIIRTSTEIIFTDKIQPIALPIQNIPKQGKITALMSGWGHNSFESNRTAPNILHFVQLRIIDNKYCEKDYEQFAVKDTNICTYGFEKFGFCDGDSGGPLVDSSQQFLLGMASGSIDVNNIDF